MGKNPNLYQHTVHEDLDARSGGHLRGLLLDQHGLGWTDKVVSLAGGRQGGHQGDASFFSLYSLPALHLYIQSSINLLQQPIFLITIYTGLDAQPKQVHIQNKIISTHIHTHTERNILLFRSLLLLRLVSEIRSILFRLCQNEPQCPS